MSNKEQRFYEALRDVFIGAPVEGQSGYINLMRIKARYYEAGVFPHLRGDIGEALKPFPDFSEELFDRLYTFFHRYFSESGSIYYRYTPLHERIYEQVYTDDRDVMLFWKTHMLYYVKTDRLFQNMDVDVDDHRFFFDISTVEHKRANEKRALVYEFKEKGGDGALVFTVTYSERGRKTSLDQIRRAIKDAQGLNRYTPDVPSEETLERAFRLFERQSEVDYFINKDARAFLQEQFDLWLYQYVFKGETEWSEKRIRQLQALKDIAYQIIDFIAQFEDELVRIWNKPKFVLNSHYVITLDRIASREGGNALLERLLAHPRMAEQVDEWRQLGMVDETFTAEQVWQTDLPFDKAQGKPGRRLHDRYQYLPLDTRHFKDLEPDILALFDHPSTGSGQRPSTGSGSGLDQELDGWLVKSENYQALNTLLPKFRERVQCIYIDPPYNAEGSEVLYLNNYRSSSWLTMMENRLAIASSLLSRKGGTLCVAVDDFEMSRLVQFMREEFTDYDINTIVVNHHPQGSPKANISRTHEYLLTATPSDSDFIRIKRPEGRSEERPFMRTGTGDNNFRLGRPNSFYAVMIDPQTASVKGAEEPPRTNGYPREPTRDGYLRVYPIDGSGQERVWRKSFVSVNVAIQKGMVFGRLSNGKPTVYEKAIVERIKPTSNWFDSKYNAGTYGTALLTDLFGKSALFLYPKSIHSVLDPIDAITYEDEEAIILDFFAGSGTTAHAVINLNRQDGGHRKYILVEMADYFDTVLLPRVKKVVFSDKWKDGQAQDGQGIGHFVKVFHLEQYEDALRCAHYGDAAPLFVQADPYSQYVFLRDTKMLDNAATGERVVEVDIEQEAIRVDLSKLYDGIDLAETLSCVTGKWIRRITPQEVEFEDGERVSLASPPWELVKPLLWWGKP